MTDTTINLRDYQISRWRKLAEQRLEHITDLFVTGRWRRYFTEKDFLDQVRQTRDAVAAWQRLDAPQLETPMPERLSFAVADTAETPATVPERSAPMPVPAAVGVLAPNMPLDVFLEEPEPIAMTVAKDLRTPMRLPSPFEDAVGAMALERVGRL